MTVLLHRRSAWARYGMALAIALLVLGIRASVDPAVGEEYAIAILFLAIQSAAWLGGFGPAMFVTIAGLAGMAYFFPDPNDENDSGLIGLLVFFVMTLGIALLGAGMSSARRRAENVAEELWTTLSSIGDAVLVSDADGRVKSLNPVAERLTGWTIAEALHQPLEDVFVILHEKTRRPVESPVEKVLREERVVGLANHTILIAKDGTEVAIDDSAAPIRAADGKIQGVVLVFRDVTQRRRSDEELRLKREQLQLITDSLPAQVAFINAREEYEFVNEPYAERLVQTKDEILGRTVRDVLGDENYGRIEAHLKAALAGERKEYELRMRSPDSGEVEFHQIVYVPHRLGNGAVAGCNVLILDASERRRTEELVRQRAAQQQAVAELGQLALVEYDLQKLLETAVASITQTLSVEYCKVLERLPSGEGFLLRAGEGWKPGVADAILSIDASSQAGYTLQSNSPVVVEDLRTETRFRGPKLLREHGVVSGLTCIIAGAGESSHWGVLGAHTTSRRHFTRDDVNFLMSVANLLSAAIKHRQFEVALQEQQADLEAARLAAESANQSKSEFLANMSHEIRTPMTAILGYANLLRSHLVDPDDVHCVETIQRNGEFLLEIIGDILDLSRIEAGRLEIECEPFAPDELVADLYSLMQLRAREKGLDFIVEFEGPVPERIRSDQTRLRQILVNLVGNAIKFTETGSVRIVVRTLREEQLLRFSVIDTGIGMTAEQQVGLFQPFTQADSSVTRQFGGSGLGLVISQRLAQMLGGEITLLSQFGEGSTFMVEIATGELRGVDLVEARTESAPLPAPLPQPRRLDCRVLVVDDRREVRYLAQHVLEEAGATVAVVTNGQHAIDAVHAHAERGVPVDLILMDMQMPVMDGYVATAKLRSAGFMGPIVALTAHAMAGAEEKCLNAGCDDYAAKPINPNELVAIAARYTQDIPADELLAHRLRRAEQEAESPLSDVNPTAKGRRILLVDDCEDACSLMRMLLEKTGYRVHVANRGASAIEAARKHRPHVVVLDITLPDMSGHDVARRLKQMDETKLATLIALSGHGSADDRRRSLAAGFDHHLQKPPDYDTLQRLLAEG